MNHSTVSHHPARVTVILGATPKEDRFANRAMRALQSHGEKVVPVNPAFQEVLGERCLASIADVQDWVHTVTMYVGEKRSTPLMNEILAIKPKRIIFNPGAENPTLADAARKQGIEVVEDCTLVMLREDRY